MTVVEHQDLLEVISPMPPGRRGLFLVLALVPLLAPHQLLVAPGWHSFLNPFFAFAALISLGALALSAFLVWAAVAGIEATARFDRGRGTLTLVERAPIMPLRRRTCDLDDLRAVEVATTEWSDGAPSYSLRIETHDGQVLSLLGGYERAEVEEVVQRIDAFRTRSVP